MKIRFFILLILFLPASSLLAKKKVNTVFYAQNTLNGFKNRPANEHEMAKLLKSVGYDGLEGFGDQNFVGLRKTLEGQGLRMPVIYAPLNFEVNRNSEKPSFDEIKEIIKAATKGTVVYFHLHSDSYKNDKEKGDQVVAAMLRELSGFAAGYGVKLGVYPHVTLYCETLEHSVKLAKMVDRKNYGAVLNLCHLLKVEGSSGIEDKIKMFTPWLVAVNICGADEGDTRQMGWERLIQPLGQGSFDTYRLVKLLLDNGYRGPIGLQCYNLKGDAAETLTKSLQTWKAYKERYLMGDLKSTKKEER
jgi:sugar phosphate isomerase/epimerase